MSTHTLIADRIEIADLFARFGLLLDEKRWDDAHTVFTDDVTGHSPRSGDIQGLDKLVAFMRQSDVEGEHAQHVTADLLVDLNGDEAAAAANSLVYFFREGEAPHQSSGLRLTCKLARTTAGWRIRDVLITLAWTQRNS